MNIIILGAGQTGIFVASILSQEKHNVILIDKDAGLLEKTGRELDIATLCAHAPNWKLFTDLVKESPDVFFAATGHDEINLVCSAMAKKAGVPKTIARVKSKEYLNQEILDFGHLFCVDHFISPELLAAQDLFKVLGTRADIASQHFAHGAIQMRTILIPHAWDKAHVPIQELDLPEHLIVALIHRHQEGQIEDIIPHGSDYLLPGDEATLIGESALMNQLHKIFHIEEKKVRSIILVGGSTIAVHLASFLLRQHIQVRIIEADPSRCLELADLLPESTIINRDGRDSSLLLAERVQDADALVACLEEEGTNFLIASLARKLGCIKSIALISDPALAPLLEKLEVIPALSAKASLTNKMLSLIHKETLLSVTPLTHSCNKIAELQVGPDSRIIGIPLADLRLPKNLLIAVIEQQGKVSIGRGNSFLSPHDIAIAICQPEHINHLQHIFHS
ncbi:MAG: Trk system potassium transporter TrkA [Chlamydiales bacterium]|nr:Trk system potassium transporter TrkA [Chlamydiales bacterium]